MSGETWDSIAAFTKGERLRAELLRTNLEAIRDKTESQHFRRLVEDTLAGRKTLREILRDDQFEDELNRGMDRFADHWAQLTPEERAELVRQGRQQEARRREELGLPERPEAEPEPGDSPLLRRW